MKFTFNPRIIRQLGTELITSDYIAFVELIKNSYDAGSKIVHLQFLRNINKLRKEQLLSPIIPEVQWMIETAARDFELVLVEDLGRGMNEATIQNGFFEIGSDIKTNEKLEREKNKNHEMLLGEKGIGRLAAQRLAPLLLLETSSEGTTHLVEIYWANFTKKGNADAPSWSFPSPSANSYTRLWLIGNPDQQIRLTSFFQGDLKNDDLFGRPLGLGTGVDLLTPEFESCLNFLKSPFEIATDEKSIKVWLDSKEVSISFKSDTLLLAESVHSFKIERRSTAKGLDLQLRMSLMLAPWFLERVHANAFEKNLFQDWRKEPKFYQSLQEKYEDNYDQSLNETVSLLPILRRRKIPIEHLSLLADVSPIEGKVYSFKRDSNLIKSALSSLIENEIILDSNAVADDIRQFLNAHNGIKLYRNGYRIGTIGNKDNDWLELQQKRTKGQQFYRFDLGNVTGYIQLNDPYQRHFNETSSREGLNHNPHVESLKSVLDIIFDHFSNKFTKNAELITIDILDREGLIPKNKPEVIQREIDDSRKILSQAKENLKAITGILSSLGDASDLDTPEKITKVRAGLLNLEKTTRNFEGDVIATERSLKSATTILDLAEQQQKRLEVDTFNNYKLMANGLITEVITHELHSAISGEGLQEKYELNFNAIKEELFKDKKFGINKRHLEPIHGRFIQLHNKIQDLNRFYSFIDKTFLYKGNLEDYELVNIFEYVTNIRDRFLSRLSENKIDLEYRTTSKMEWSVPKGSLLHVFYNLIDNAIYWILERRKRSNRDKTFSIEKDDLIVIKRHSDKILHIFDTGTGVLPNYQYTLFNPLESGKPDGRGMGLYIVRNFLRSFGAEIELLPDLNLYGNRFIFEIRLENN